jgi:hypothetical protein
MQIQPRDLVPRRQHGGQLQLCVPQVVMDGPSYRPRKRPGTTQPIITTGKQATMRN